MSNVSEHRWFRPPRSDIERLGCVIGLTLGLIVPIVVPDPWAESGTPFDGLAMIAVELGMVVNDRFDELLWVAFLLLISPIAVLFWYLAVREVLPQRRVPKRIRRPPPFFKPYMVFVGSALRLFVWSLIAMTPGLGVAMLLSAVGLYPAINYWWLFAMAVVNLCSGLGGLAALNSTAHY